MDGFPPSFFGAYDTERIAQKPTVSYFPAHEEAALAVAAIIEHALGAQLKALPMPTFEELMKGTPFDPQLSIFGMIQSGKLSTYLKDNTYITLRGRPMDDALQTSPDDKESPKVTLTVESYYLEPFTVGIPMALLRQVDRHVESLPLQMYHWVKNRVRRLLGPHGEGQ